MKMLEKESKRKRLSVKYKMARMHDRQKKKWLLNV